MTKQECFDYIITNYGDVTTELFHFFGLNLTNYHKINLRDLYDFYERYGIFIFITPKIEIEENHPYYHITILTYHGEVMEEGDYSERLEAEKNAFIKALYYVNNN